MSCFIGLFYVLAYIINWIRGLFGKNKQQPKIDAKAENETVAEPVCAGGT